MSEELIVFQPHALTTHSVVFPVRPDDSEDAARSGLQDGLCNQRNILDGVWPPQHADVTVPGLRGPL